MAQHISVPASPLSLGQLVLYFLKLGTIGFGGPVALVGFMRKDLVDDGEHIDEATYNLAIALAQIMPGPWRRRRRSPSATSRAGCWAPRWSGSPSSCRPSSWCSPCPGCT